MRTYIYYYNIDPTYCKCNIATEYIDKELLDSFTAKYNDFLDREIKHIITTNNLKKDCLYRFFIKFPKKKYLDSSKDTLTCIKHLLFTYSIKYNYIFHLYEDEVQEDFFKVDICNKDYFREDKLFLDLKEIDQQLLLI